MYICIYFSTPYNIMSCHVVGLYWAEFMAERDPEFVPLATELKNSRHAIVDEFKHSQGSAVDVGGYYKLGKYTEC